MLATETVEMQAREESEGARAGHVPVLGTELVELVRAALGTRARGWMVDGTVGLGGHAALLLEALPALSVFAVDQDPAAVERASEHLAAFEDRVRVRHARISELPRAMRAEGLPRPAAMLFDLGVSSMQLDTAERGFSFQADGPLDMRMDPRRDRTAAEIVNHWDEKDLADLIFHEGGEPRARTIARAIVEGRRRAPFLRTGALADLIAHTLRGSARGGKIHPATLTFQALRRAVNEEGEELGLALSTAERSLADGGVLAVISFHSGEDRVVKRFLAEGVRARRWRALTDKPLEAGAIERRMNPRSRSARLRAALRTLAQDDAPPPARSLVRAHSSPLFSRRERGTA